MSKQVIDFIYIGFDGVDYRIRFDGPIEERDVMAEMDFMANSSGHSFSDADFRRIREIILHTKLEIAGKL